MVVKCVNAAAVHNGTGTSSNSLTLDKQYTVYGIGIRKLDPLTYFSASDIAYLIASDNGIPVFCDASRFEVIDSSMPKSWQFAYFGDIRNECDDRQRAYAQNIVGAAEGVVGYPELVANPFHYIGIEMGEDKDIQTFNMRRRDIDSWLSRTGLASVYSLVR